MRSLLLIDNGSTRAETTLNLRRLAATLSERIGEAVHPVSLLHSSRVPPAELGDRPPDRFEPFLQRHLAAGVRDFLVLPLFFGRGGALNALLPDKVASLRSHLGPFDLRLADVLCPLPEGEPRLEQILWENVLQTAQLRGLSEYPVVLVDHGSPLPEVTQVRRVLAARLRQRMVTGAALHEAVMERRRGKEYDFNGDLLEAVLRRLAAEQRERPVVVSMLFLSAGRHAGPGGDIQSICERVAADHPGFCAFPTPLVGSHPGLIDILEHRYRGRYSKL